MEKKAWTTRQPKKRRIVINCLWCGTKKVVHRRNMYYCSEPCRTKYGREREKRKAKKRQELDPRFAISKSMAPLKYEYKKKTDSELIIQLFRQLLRVDITNNELERRGIDASKESIEEHWKKVGPFTRKRRKPAQTTRDTCPKCGTAVGPAIWAGKSCNYCGFILMAEKRGGDESE